MNTANSEISMNDLTIADNQHATTSTPSSTALSADPIDDETKRRKILSKLWGKGSKSSQKVRELNRSTVSNSSDSSAIGENDQQQMFENLNNSTLQSSTNDPKSLLEDNSNSINISKPLAVVKPILVVKSGHLTDSSIERPRVSSEPSPTTITQTNETMTTTTTTTVTERQSSSSAATSTSDRALEKKKKAHKSKESKSKSKRDESVERNQSHNRHHSQKKDDEKFKERSSSSNTNQRRRDEHISTKNDHNKSHHHSSSMATSSNKKRQSSFHDDENDGKSIQSKASKKDEISSSNDRHYRRRSSKTPSPSPSRSRHPVKNESRTQSKNLSSIKKEDEHGLNRTPKSDRQQNESYFNSKSTNSISPPDSSTNNRHRQNSNTTIKDENYSQKTNTNDNQPKTSIKSQDISPEHRSLSSTVKEDKSKSILNNNEIESNRNRTSSRHDRRSYSRHRSRSRENKTNRKTIEPSNSDESSAPKHKSNNDKDSTKVNENTMIEKKSSRVSPMTLGNDEHRRKSSSDYHRHDRHDSPSHRKDYEHYYHSYNHHHHRRTPTHSYYSKGYSDHHRYHYRSPSSSKYRSRRRSVSSRSHHRRTRYYSSTSSSLSFTPRRRRYSSRTTSSSSRSSSTYSSVSRSTSSRSTSRSDHRYYHRHHHEKSYRRSPTLEKLFIKASESIESISTEKNPKSSTHLIPIQTSTGIPNMAITPSTNPRIDPNTLFAENLSGFSAPPPPFLPHPQQRCLKEITTESSATHRMIVNNIPFVQPQSSNSSLSQNEFIEIKAIQSNETLTNVRPSSSKPPRISRFSDIAPTTQTEPLLNTNLPLDTQLNYNQISENIICLPASRRQQKRHNREVMECECTTNEYDQSRGIKACGSECLNRMLLIECGPNCPCGNWCTNRRFQKRSYATHKLALFKTDKKGHGLRTTAPIRKGRFLVEYVGEVIDMDELARRSKKYKRDGNVHQYVMSLIHGTVIDSTIKGNWARFINHSCEPNCSAEKWLVNGEYRMGIFAKRDLDENEEITIDYRFETFGAVDLINEKCYCGAPTCRGTISVRNNSNNNNNNNTSKRQNRRLTLDDDELIDYLREEETNEYVIPKTIDEIRQLIQIMSRTDSENVRMMELDLIKTVSQKHVELPRLFLECNGLHVLVSWMKDILIDDSEQQYSNEFKHTLLDFIHTILPIKDRTTVIKNGLFDLVHKNLLLPTVNNTEHRTDQEQINELMNSMLDHLDNSIIIKLFYIYSTWNSLKERFVIPKRKDSSEASNYHHHHHSHHHHHHHHHHSSKHPCEETSSRYHFSTNSSTIQQKPIERQSRRRYYHTRDTPRTYEHQLSKDERRKLFEQQYEDAEKAKAAAAATLNINESPGAQNEPPYKKQRMSDSKESATAESSMVQTNLQMVDQTYCIHQYLSQIPFEYIESYLASIGQSISSSIGSINKQDDAPVPPPVLPDDENELSRIIRLPTGWNVAMSRFDSSVYFYNRETKEATWVLPLLTKSFENLNTNQAPIDLSPLSSAHVVEQRHSNFYQQLSSAIKPSKHMHRYTRSHRHHNHHHHHMSSNNKRKRPATIEKGITDLHDENPQTLIESSMTANADEQSIQNDNVEVLSSVESKEPMNISNEMDTAEKQSTQIDDDNNESNSYNANAISSSTKENRDILRKNISQHVHMTLKPYTKRTCKQGRITSADDMKYLVKKFTLAVLDKEIEKARNEGISLSPVLTDRVRLKTEVYVKKYMNKMGSAFRRHDTSVQQTLAQPAATTTIATNSE